MTSSSDGRLFARALDYVIKAGRVFPNANGYSLTPEIEPFEKPAPKPVPIDRAPVEPRLINLARLPRVLGVDTYNLTHLSDEKPITPAHTTSVTEWIRTPHELRPPGKARVGVTASTTWLFTYSYTPSKTQVHTATVVGRDGETIRRIELSAKPRSWIARPDRDWVTILDDDLTVWVYRLDGALMNSVDLRTTPEIAAILKDPDANDWRLRCADFDPGTRRTLFTFDDTAWCLNPDDRGVAWRGPGVPLRSRIPVARGELGVLRGQFSESLSISDFARI